jgi:transcription elongation factor GreB
MADAPPRFITPEGFALLRAEYDDLFGVERPKIVEVVSWAASLGDRSENADYLYGKKRLREIDRRLSHLSKIMKAAKVVDPASQAAREQVRFGATVEVADDDDNRRTLTIVGEDEADASAGRIGWSAPLARALVGAKIGAERTVRLPPGEKSYLVMAIRFPDDPTRGLTSCGGSAGIAFDHASAIASSAVSAACCSSSPSIVRHGDQRVSVLARSSSRARW